MSKSVISEGKTTQEAIEKGLKEIKLPRELCEIKILGENKKSVAYSLIFFFFNKTVKDKEINFKMNSIITVLKKT